MKTQPRPEVRASRFDPWTVAGDALLALGFASIVIGIYEVGGVFAIGVGLGLAWIGMLAALTGDQRRRERDDEAFRWVVADGPAD